MKKQKGFSLIELIIVIALLGILGALASYSWQRYTNNANLKTAAREVMADMALSKQRAVSEGISYCMQFTDGSQNYSINATSCSAPTWTQAKNLTTFGPGLTVTNTNFALDQITFFTRGTTNAGTMTLANSRNSTATITVTLTGRTYVQFTVQ